MNVGSSMGSFRATIGVRQSTFSKKRKILPCMAPREKTRLVIAGLFIVALCPAEEIRESRIKSRKEVRGGFASLAANGINHSFIYLNLFLYEIPLLFHLTPTLSDLPSPCFWSTLDHLPHQKSLANPYSTHQQDARCSSFRPCRRSPFQFHLIFFLLKPNTKSSSAKSDGKRTKGVSANVGNR